MSKDKHCECGRKLKDGEIEFCRQCEIKEILEALEKPLEMVELKQWNLQQQ